jgi:hypothetical protein
MDPKCIEFGLSEAGCNAISPGLYICYVLFGIAAAASIILPIINTIKNPSVLIKSGISLAVLVVIFVISYGLADSNVSAIAKSLDVGGGSVRLIGAGLIMFYIVFFLSVIGIVYSEINKALK